MDGFGSPPLSYCLTKRTTCYLQDCLRSLQRGQTKRREPILAEHYHLRQHNSFESLTSIVVSRATPETWLSNDATRLRPWKDGQIHLRQSNQNDTQGESVGRYLSQRQSL